MKISQSYFTLNRLTIYGGEEETRSRQKALI